MFFYKLSLIITVLSLKQRQGSLFGNHMDPFSVESEAANVSQATSQWPLQMSEGVNNNRNITSSITSHRFVCFSLDLVTFFCWILTFTALLPHHFITLLSCIVDTFGQRSTGAWVWHWNMLYNWTQHTFQQDFQPSHQALSHILKLPIKINCEIPTVAQHFASLQ